MKKLVLLLLCLGFNGAVAAGQDAATLQFEQALQAYQAKDYGLARQAFKSLAETGHSDAQLYLGIIHDKGLGGERDARRAFYWFEKSAEQGDVKLQYQLALRYLNGAGVAQDYGKARYWMKKAADAGAAQAQYNLGLMSMRGHGAQAKAARTAEAGAREEQAVALFRLAADQGLRDAQYALGLAYTTGKVLSRDYGKACQLFRLAAEQGYPSAQYNLAVLTESGEGVEKSTDEAIAWYRKAATQGHELARQRLAELDSQIAPGVESKQLPQALTDVNTATISTPSMRVIHGHSWINSQSAAHYTIQINASHNEEKLVGWLRGQKSLAPLAYYRQQVNGQVIYKAVYGSFKTKTAAQEALVLMAPDLLGLKPWLRRFEAVQAQLPGR